MKQAKHSKPSKNPFESDEFKRWADTMRTRMIPQMRDSQHVLMIAPSMETEFDIDFALQIGASILLGKPLILLVDRGRTVPPKLLAIADRIIEVDMDETTMDSADIQRQLQQAFDDFGKQ